MALTFPGECVQFPRARTFLAVTVALFVAQPRVGAAADDKKRAEREALKTSLMEVLRREPLNTSRVSVHMRRLDDGSVVFSHNADELLNPASNVKLVTSAAALATLGSEYRFETEFLVETESDGIKAKTLYVRGKGDPSVTTERLFGMTGDLFHTGLREVQDIIVDDAWFDAERTPSGYDQEDSDRAYMSPTGALSLNWNAVGVYLRAGDQPGAKGVVEVEPPSDYFVVESTLTTGDKRARRFSVASDAAGGQQKRLGGGQGAPRRRRHERVEEDRQPAHVLRPDAQADAGRARYQGEGQGEAGRHSAPGEARVRGAIGHLRHRPQEAQQDVEQLHRRDAPQDDGGRGARRSGHLRQGPGRGGGLPRARGGDAPRHLRDEERQWAQRRQPLLRHAVRQDPALHVRALPGRARVPVLAGHRGQGRHAPLPLRRHRGRGPAARQDGHAGERVGPERLCAGGRWREIHLLHDGE